MTTREATPILTFPRTAGKRAPAAAPVTEPPPVLLEEWLPARAIGIECKREHQFMAPFPPNVQLHVWWARRPLAISRAAVLCSLLPADADRGMVERLLGLSGGANAILAAADTLDQARLTGERIPSPFGPRAFSAALPEDAVDAAHRAMSRVWGSLPTVLDPMAGGGSIPLEAARIGLPTAASDFNPVAAAVMLATVDHPLRFGPRLAKRAAFWAKEWKRHVDARLQPLYSGDADTANTYIFARTVPCRETGHPTPLVPDWMLLRPNVVAVPTHVDSQTGTWRTEIKRIGHLAGEVAKAPESTYIRGGGRSLFGSRSTFPAAYVQGQAQAGKLGYVLYAVATKAPKLDFRPPTQADQDALALAEQELARLKPQWERDGILPTQELPEITSDQRPRLYGGKKWTDLFAPRQLLALGVLAEELKRLEPDIRRADDDMADAIVHLLALVVDKVANYDSLMSSWEPTKKAMRSVFDRHDFAFKATFAEMPLSVSGGGLQWAIGNVLKAARQLAELPKAAGAEPAAVQRASATNLWHLDDGSVTAVVVDPPYYDNVQYSELADYFYVWLQRTIGDQHPDWFETDLCPKNEEAVANTARHRALDGMAGDARRDAHAYYERQMLAAFKEARRVLRPDGVLTVMFTHTKTEAWNALAGSLRDAGFIVKASWPVTTESATSLHIRDQNAAQSTVLLCCRPRRASAGTGYWEELRPQVVRAAQAAAERLGAQSLSGVDQLVGAFGPAIGVASAYDEVRDVTGRPVGFDRVMQEAAGAVAAWRAAQLAAQLPSGTGSALADMDAISRAALLWWAQFGSASIAFDQVRLLALALGLDTGDLVQAGVAVRAKGNLALLAAAARRRAQPHLGTAEPEGGHVHPRDERFATALDVCHALALAALEADPPADDPATPPAPAATDEPAPVASPAGTGAARALWNRLPAGQRTQAGALLQALVAATPRAAQFGPGARDFPEFGIWRSLLEPLGLGAAIPWQAPGGGQLMLPTMEAPVRARRGQ
ncbi:MAG: DUF1156 domain-containing protein [Chloroflexi bacterium]|nr:DUF1156 domain-containing protein [Chloroflexota bacterium]